MSLKIAVVTALIMQSSLPNKLPETNYRCTPPASCVIAKHSSSHINGNILDNPRQSAYNVGHSIEMALMLIK